MNIKTLIKEIRSYDKNADTDMVRLAYDFAAKAHGQTKRLSGELFITHPLATAVKLTEWKMDQTTIIAGLLHDVHEDADVSLKDIEKHFGKPVAKLVEGVSKLDKLRYRGVVRYVESLRKMFIAMAQDIRVIIIKFADRWHNLTTLDYLPAEKRIRIAKETMEIYVPIASRLGIGEVRGQLEDLAFKHLDPVAYKKTEELLESHTKKLGGFINKISSKINKELKKLKVTTIDIHGRKKHIYSLYKKLNRPEIDHDVSKIYDFIALRVIVENVDQCYAALGVIHKMWKPLKGRIKDYIAQPKPNGYQSIHTTVFAEKGRIIEIQIRDKEMHNEAEYGVAAHWHYDESDKPKDKAIPVTKKLQWVKELAKWKKEYQGDPQYLEILKIDILQNQILVFTPKGDVVELPENSTPIDFAYHVHTDLGDKCTGAKVNDNIAPLDTKLKNGDVVFILTDKRRKGPNLDWLDFVKTRTAKGRIKRSRHS